MWRNEIGFVISTNRDYREVAAQRCLDSLIRFGVPWNQILVVNGRNDKPHTECYPTHIEATVTYGAYDYTALVYVAEAEYLPRPWSRVFLLHDTCEITEQTPALVEAGANFDVDVTAIQNGLCNFGLYSVEYLRRQRSFLQSLKGMDKFTSIEVEGALVRRGWGSVAHYPNDHLHVEEGYHDVYGTGSKRIIEFYHAVQMKKFKGNHGQTHRGNYLERP